MCLSVLSRDGHSVLVHGSEGTDCTLLISTLAQLIVDPCCRTLEGFLALLEREWVQVRECVHVKDWKRLKRKRNASDSHSFPAVASTVQQAQCL